MGDLDRVLHERDTIQAALNIARVRRDEDSVMLLEYLLLRWDGVLALIDECARMHA